MADPQSALHVRLDVYEGPLELLLDLIEREQIDIWDIPIARLTDQYVAYLASAEELDLELAGEFLVMAATLLRIKARMLMPVVPDEDGSEKPTGPDPRQSLAEQLAVYRIFRDKAQWLKGRLEARRQLYVRGLGPGTTPRRVPLFLRPVGNATVKDLHRAYVAVLSAVRNVPPNPVELRDITVAERVNQLREVLSRSHVITFAQLIATAAPGPERRRLAVVTFLALLELVRNGYIETWQEQPFGPLRMKPVPTDHNGSGPGVPETEPEG